MVAFLAQVGIAGAQNAAREARLPMGRRDAEPVGGIDGLALEQGGMGRDVAAAYERSVRRIGDHEFVPDGKGGRRTLEALCRRVELVLEELANYGAERLDSDDSGVL